MKPWEETWAQGDDPQTDGVAICPEYRDGEMTCALDWFDARRGGTGEPEARARLAAAAPEMARLLLDLQDIDSDFTTSRIDPGDQQRIREVLRKAGVPT